jgi:polyisoprenoid-binding protein YceI
MFKILITTVLMAICTFANTLQVQEGLIKAHTEVFGDSTINPQTKHIGTSLTIEDSIESIQGVVFISAKDLISDNSKRDEHMYEVLEVESFSTISFTINKIIKENDTYMLQGVLALHGIKKQMNIKADISKENGTVSLQSQFSIKMTDFGIEPPVMIFLTVRDQIDIDINLNFKEK